MAHATHTKRFLAKGALKFRNAMRAVGGALKKVGAFAWKHLKPVAKGALENAGAIAGGIASVVPGGEKYAGTAKNIGDVVSGVATKNLDKIKEGIKDTKVGDIVDEATKTVKHGKGLLPTLKDNPGGIGQAGKNFIDQAKKTWTTAKQGVQPVAESVADKRTLRTLQEASQMFAPK